MTMNKTIPITRETLIAGIAHLDAETLRQEYASLVLQQITERQHAELLEIRARNVAEEAKIHGGSARLTERAAALVPFCDLIRFGE